MGNQKSSPLDKAVENRYWSTVLHIVQNETIYSAKERKKAVDVFVRDAPHVGHSRTGAWWWYGDIIPHCNSDQLDIVLARALTGQRWYTVSKVLKRGFTQHRHAVEEASKRADDEDFKGFILPHCSDDQLGVVLTHLVTRGLWWSVGNVLERGVINYTQHRHAVKEASKRAGDVDFERYILPHCHDDQLGVVLTHLVTRGLWMSVGELLKRGVSDTQYAVEEASKRADGWVFESHILPHCRDDQLGVVLTHLVTRGLWMSVGNVLERGVSDTQHRHAVEEASKRADGWNFEGCILPHCSDDQLDAVLTHLVTRGLWMTVGIVLERGVINYTQHRHAVEEASKRTDDWDFEHYILPHCNDHLLGDVLIHLVRRHLWRSVGKVLERSVKDIHHTHAVEEASKTADDHTFEYYILPHCRNNQLDDVLTHLVTRGLWMSVGKVLERGVSDTQHRHALEEASKRADFKDLERFILFYCSDHQLVLTHFVTRGLWESVGKMLERGVSDAQNRYAVEEASKRADDEDFERFILPHCSNQLLNAVLTHLLTRGLLRSFWAIIRRGGALRFCATEMAAETKDGNSILEDILPHCSPQEKARIVLPRCITSRKWKIVRRLIFDSIEHALCHWTKAMNDISNDSDEGFWLIMKYCRVQSSLAQEVSTALRQDFNIFTKRVTKYFPLTSNDMKVLSRSVLFILCCVICGGLTQDLLCISDRLMTEIRIALFANQSPTVTTIPGVTRLSDEKNLLITLTVHPYPLELPLAVKNMVLQNMLRHKKWNVISHVTTLSGVWENVRRDLIQQAVEQRQWSVVKQWADHTVFDNQRWWALQEAYKHKQWQVMLLLADHGLTETELMWVRYRLAMYADWDVVLQMFERGVDVTEVREVVESNMTARKTARDPEKRQTLERRWKRLLVTEERLTRVLYGKRRGGRIDTSVDSQPVEVLTRRQAKLRALKATKLGKWCLVFFHFHRNLKDHCLQEALQMAVDSEAWHVVIQLVRLLRMDTAQRDSFFTEMFRRQQWAVCRALLDQGLSVHTCLDVLPQLMEMDQWSLVARVTEFNVTDAVKRHILVRAMERREGSVVWRCISTMQHCHLSVKEKEELFQQAFSREVWQAIKPLVEEKDSSGIRHRDTALLAAIEQHQWDVVDYCQLYHADINMKDEQGETPLNRAARNKDWKAVEELVVRGADPNLLDMEGSSVMYRTIMNEQWDTVKLLITCLADVHQNSRTGRTYRPYMTPLQALIKARQGEIIHHSLMWCPDQSMGVTLWGETTLHATALRNRPDFLYYQVVREVNPLTPTRSGGSVLLYAVQNRHCPQRMVAECIRLGFSTHQPQLTGRMPRDFVEFVLNVVIKDNHQSLMMKSPFLLSVLAGQFVLAHMLYESGSCSNTELHYVYHHLLAMTDHFTEEGTRLWAGLRTASGQENYGRLMKNTETFLPYLKEMATTPRSLVSSCRLVISHCLNVHRRYYRDVQHLYLTEKIDPRLSMTGSNVLKIPLPDRVKNYILFSDLTDPDYEWYLFGRLTDKQ